MFHWVTLDRLSWCWLHCGSLDQWDHRDGGVIGAWHCRHLSSWQTSLVLPQCLWWVARFMVMSCGWWLVICMGGRQGDGCALVQNFQQNCQSCRTDIFLKKQRFTYLSPFSQYSAFLSQMGWILTVWTIFKNCPFNQDSFLMHRIYYYFYKIIWVSSIFPRIIWIGPKRKIHEKKDTS